MNYKHVYMRIISHAKSEVEASLRPKTKSQKYKFPNQYFEFHHILPKSLFPNWVQKGSNIVPLTAREHFFCHQLLTKIYPCKQMYLALRAFQHNPNADYKLTARDYESLKENNAKLKQQYFQSEEFKAKRREIASTFCKSPEYKEKCRIAALKSRTPEVKKKISEGCKKHFAEESAEAKALRYAKMSESRKNADHSKWKTRTNYTKLSTETKEKIREKVKAHHADPVYRQHISDTWKAWREKGNVSHKRSSRCIETGEFFLTLKNLKEKFGRDAIVALFSGNAAKTGLHYEFV